MNGWWFLHAYVFMMMLVPLVNIVMERDRESAMVVVLPLLVLVGFWGFGKTLPIVHRILPSTNGIGAYGGITLLGIYAAARLFRKYDVKPNVKWLWISLPTLWCLTGIGLGAYNSPCAFALAAVCFLLISRIKLEPRITRIIMFVAPSMFSVYLIHTNRFGFSAMHIFENLLLEHNIPLVFAFIVTGLFAFLAAFCVDLFCRLLLAMVAMVTRRFKNA